MTSQRFQAARRRGQPKGTLWIETALPDARWRAAFRLLPGPDGLPLVAEVRVFPADDYPGRMAGEWSAERLGGTATVPEGGITARLLRTLKLGDNQRQFVDRVQREFAPIFTRRGFAASNKEEPTGRASRPDVDLFYARLARDYAALYAKGISRPVLELARRRGLRPARVRDLVHEARRRGVLSPARAGKAGGVLTPRGAALLQSAQPRPKRRAKGGQ